MSSTFNRQNWKITSDPDASKQVRVLNQGDGAVYQVKEYEAEAIKTTSKTPPELRDSKAFRLNHLQGQLRQEQEKEQKAIEDEIQKALAAAKEEGLKQGFAQGHAEGIEAGKQEGLQKYLIDMRGNVAKITQLVQGFEGVKGEIYAANERILIQIAHHIAKKIVLRELSTDQEFIQRTVKDIIDRMGIKDGVRIKVAPKDLFRLENLKKELVETFTTLKNVSIESSDKVQSGCIVETEFNVIDAQLETQFAEIFGALAEKAAEKTENDVDSGTK